MLASGAEDGDSASTILSTHEDLFIVDGHAKRRLEGSSPRTLASETVEVEDSDAAPRTPLVV